MSGSRLDPVELQVLNGANAAALVRALRDARAHVFGGCGHATPLERTGEFNRLVTTFLETR